MRIRPMALSNTNALLSPRGPLYGELTQLLADDTYLDRILDSIRNNEDIARQNLTALGVSSAVIEDGIAIAKTGTPASELSDKAQAVIVGFVIVVSSTILVPAFAAGITATAIVGGVTELAMVPLRQRQNRGAGVACQGLGQRIVVPDR